jgi:hypothetical protein
VKHQLVDPKGAVRGEPLLEESYWELFELLEDWLEEQFVPGLQE